VNGGKEGGVLGVRRWGQGGVGSVGPVGNVLKKERENWRERKRRGKGN
jgi:hypothetical protein